MQALTLGVWFGRAQTGKKRVRFFDATSEHDYTLVGCPTTMCGGYSDVTTNELSTFGFIHPKVKRRAIYVK